MPTVENDEDVIYVYMVLGETLLLGITTGCLIGLSFFFCLVFALLLVLLLIVHVVVYIRIEYKENY